MSTVNERLRAENTALIIWLTAAVKKLGGTFDVTSEDLDRIGELSARGEEILHTENGEGGKLSMKVIVIPRKPVPANGAKAAEAPIAPVIADKSPVV